ncbi:phosphoglycerate kinase [Candidatus Micrarchaeota archaeon]|nr:phosphoglycerate kinase [Candidatus Micrarchaeota archaeon]
MRSFANSDSFSLIGGGHTITAIEKLGINKSHFSYVSLSGKALIEYLCGKDLPGLAALDGNEKTFPVTKAKIEIKSHSR